MTAVIHRNNTYKQVNAEVVVHSDKRYGEKLLVGRCPWCGDSVLYYRHSPWFGNSKGKRFLTHIVEVWDCIKCPFKFEQDTTILRPIERSAGPGYVDNISPHMAKLEQRTCLCGAVYQPKSMNQKYCGHDCAERYRPVRMR